ncbi:Inositol phosphatase SIW14 [Cladophialophora chaetospira]|uniref:ER membrane protein complex subunit 2 n=1 Tax=Cladophialophora chaetospira TaxID=386627 RepID=A0AA38WW67_9EURO|nr:Inositol phosphatase SIW14 [Cladophialophora chaetospira]
MAAVTIQGHASDSGSALQIAQGALSVLAKSSSVSTTFPASMFNTTDSAELWDDLEQLLYACLRTGDDKSAFLCVEKLSERFGSTNERVMALRGLYQEATAPDESAGRKILEEYAKILMENPMNVPIHKRRIALMKSLGRPQDAITDLVQFVDSFPTDMEAWCELSDLYHSQGCISQAIFCLEEATIIAPNAWNLHARLGELEYLASQSSTEGADSQTRLSQAIQRFSRSIELCDDYLRGFYGLKLASDKLLQTSTTSKVNSGSIVPPEKLQKLSQLAASKLQAIIKDRTARRSSGTASPEVIAAQELLNRSKG